MADNIQKFTQYVDEHKDTYIDRLRVAVSIKSISAEPEHRQDCLKMVDHTQKMLEAIGAKCEQIDNGKQTTSDGQVIPLPPILFATLGDDPKKKTLLVYGHIDVQPATIEDGWNTEPFELTEIDGKLYGRGSTDDKGPVLAWIHAIEAMQQLKIDVPVNLKFVIEAMEESGSEGLDETLAKYKDTFLSGVDFSCISDNYWLGRNKPCITVGLRGLSYFAVEVQGTKTDLHSGIYGGSVHEPLNDLVWIMGQLADSNGDILIEGIKDLIAPVTPEEEARYSTIDFDPEVFRETIEAPQLVSTKKEQLLMNRMRNPALSIHGIEGAFYGPGGKTVISAKVTGKFSIRTVPNMRPEAVEKLVINYLNKIWATRQSPNHFKPLCLSSTPYWVGGADNSNYRAAETAIIKVFGITPDTTLEGGSIGSVLSIEEFTKSSLILLPIGSADDNAHAQNEKLNVSNYIEGTKVLGLYLFELGKL